jgi:hypothetical protein
MNFIVFDSIQRQEKSETSEELLLTACDHLISAVQCCRRFSALISVYMQKWIVIDRSLTPPVGMGKKAKLSSQHC